MPSSCALSRSTSALSCCVEAEYVVARPVSSGRSRALFRNSCMTPSSATGSPVVVSWIQNSKPPVVPMPGMAGGAIGITIAPSMALACAKKPCRIARAFCCFVVSRSL